MITKLIGKKVRYERLQEFGEWTSIDLEIYQVALGNMLWLDGCIKNENGDMVYVTAIPIPTQEVLSTLGNEYKVEYELLSYTRRLSFPELLEKPEE